MIKCVRRALAAVLAIVAIGIIGVCPAFAERDAVGVAQAKLDQIKERAARADEKYAEAQLAYQDAEKKLKQIEADIVKQSTLVVKFKGDLAQLAIRQYQVGGQLEATTELLVSSNESTFLQSLATLDTVSERTMNRVQDVQLEEGKLDRLRITAADLRDRMKVAKDQQAAQVTSLKEQKSQAEIVVNRLQEADRVRLLAIQHAEQTQVIRQVSEIQNVNENQNVNEVKKVKETVAAPTGNGGSARAKAAIKFATAQVGDPYVFGASGPSGFDCSGLTSAAYASVGISLPHSASAQYRVGTPVAKANLQPGDLVFFYRGISHVGIYIGNNTMVHSAPSGHGVNYSVFSKYPAYQGARRVA